jgi:hypothetical protein
MAYGDDFQERLAAHWANLNSLKWMLWNDGVEMAEFGMTRVRNCHVVRNSETGEPLPFEESLLLVQFPIALKEETIAL